MKLKSDKKERAESKPISLYPTHISFAETRQSLGIGLSAYVQMLIEYDKENNVIAQMLAKRAEKAAA